MLGKISLGYLITPKKVASQKSLKLFCITECNLVAEEISRLAGCHLCAHANKSAAFPKTEGLFPAYVSAQIICSSGSCILRVEYTIKNKKMPSYHVRCLSQALF